MTNNTTNKTDQDNNESIVDKEIAEIYRLALFSEEFQLQRKEDLSKLPPESIKHLELEDHQYINDLEPSKEMTDRIWQNLQNSYPLEKNKAWWQKLFSSSKKKKSESTQREFPFSMGFQVPVSLAAGLVIGVLVGVQMATDFTKQSPYTSFRGGSSPITEEISSDLKSSPKKWLQSITKLIEEGNVKEAMIQLRAFETQYPNFKIKNSSD